MTYCRQSGPVRYSKEDLSKMIVENNWRSQKDLAKAAKEQEDTALYNTLLYMGRKELNDFLTWVWDLAGKSLSDETFIDRLAKLREAKSFVMWCAVPLSTSLSMVVMLSACRRVFLSQAAGIQSQGGEVLTMLPAPM